ncbi:ran-binding protein 17-like isoform X2 [Heterodontus francisci]|uniref:ran-binding protein 17-like isoform X2 n=1 Tax=Heterodontus francisci TaxID=7792 RepID=UPI00355B60E0
MAAHSQDLAQLEILCKQLYEATDPAQRLQAEKALIELTESPECLSKCQLLLEQGTTSYAQLLAATCLSKLVSRVNPLPLQQRIDIRNYILNYLASCPKLEPFVIQALVQVIAKITKMGWFEVRKDKLAFREVIADVTKFLQADSSRPLSKHRRIATSFRDVCLREIFTLACTLLREVLAKPLNLQDQRQHSLVMHLLKLVLNCLSFDFIGSSADESTDDLCTVQIPTNWRTVLLDMSTLQLFFDLYHCIPPSLSPLVLSCLAQLASVRRSLFSNTERATFLTRLMKGVQGILENPQGLSDANNYHEFCRFLARLKTNYQLGEIVMVEGYPEIIRLIANFTVTSLQHWEFAPNSVHYLLSLWQRMVASVPFVKSSEPHLMEIYAPEVTKAYITSRLESVPLIIRDGLEDPLDDTGLVFQQLEQLCTVSRCEYEKTCALLVQLFDQSAQTYQELLRSPSGRNIEIAVQEGRLAWLIYIVGAVIGGRLTFTCTDEQDTMDGELVYRVFQLVNLIDSRLPQSGNEKIELAMLNFFDQFRKTYIGDQLHRSSKVYVRISEVLSLTDETRVLEAFVAKVVNNLKCWGRSELVISRTLQFLNDLSVGYAILKKLVKIDAVRFMLQNHTCEHFPFLGISEHFHLGDAVLRCRTTFYIALTRLLLVDLGEDEDEFELFMLPLTTTFETLTQLFNSNFKQDKAKCMLIGLSRDLRGIAFALNTKASYTMLFNWLYPGYISILQRAIELWYHEPSCTTPILKLMAELVHNRSQRLNFEVSSPNGILLFREASKMISTYGNQILSLRNITKDQVYPLKLKGISICFSALKAALCGNYVSFGVFQLYGDNHFDNALQAFLKMLLSVCHSDLLSYRKLSLSYYSLLECLTQDHMTFIASLEPHVVIYIMTSLSEGLNALDTEISSACCASLDYVVTYLFKQLAKSNKKSLRQRQVAQEGERLLCTMQQNPELLQQMLSILMNCIIFEDCRNQWSMSRPLLGLILLNEKYFGELRRNLISNQHPEQQPALNACFEKLMEGVQQSLLIKNRDRALLQKKRQRILWPNTWSFLKKKEKIWKDVRFGLASGYMMRGHWDLFRSTSFWRCQEIVWFTQNMSVFKRDVTETLRISTAASNPAGTIDMMS